MESARNILKLRRKILVPIYLRSKISKQLRHLLLVMALALPGSVQALADVLDVGPDGVVTRYAGPGTFLGGLYHPLAVITPPRESSPADIEALLGIASARYGVDLSLLRAVAWNESRFNQLALSDKGAVGVMQLMEDTAQAMGVDRYDLTQNVLGGAAYLRQMLARYGGDLSLAVAAYNAGPGAVDRYHGVPPYAETQAFVGAVLQQSGVKSFAAAISFNEKVE